MSSKRHLRRKSCGTKIRYGSQREASGALAELIGKGRASPGEMHVYRCDHCGFFHKGHKQHQGPKRTRREHFG